MLRFRLVAFAVAWATSTLSSAQTTQRASVDSGGADGVGDSGSVSISGDGRYVAFASDAANLVLGDNNGALDVFLRDRVAATTIRVSLASSGAEPNANCDRPAISANGRFVAFRSEATNLVAGD